jgi:hypothetical protein
MRGIRPWVTNRAAGVGSGADIAGLPQILPEGPGHPLHRYAPFAPRMQGHPLQGKISWGPSDLFEFTARPTRWQCSTPGCEAVISRAAP